MDSCCVAGRACEHSSGSSGNITGSAWWVHDSPPVPHVVSPAVLNFALNLVSHWLMWSGKWLPVTACPH